MEHRNLKRQEPEEAFAPDRLLASRYGQLLQWAKGLTRGDANKAEEIVQEFCLYFSLAKPDLSGVSNLDGYLYTSLRHIYLSSLARASREAAHFVSIEEFDSFAFAVSASPAGDPLQRQNDLRRICGYTVWRKESSKSASYFILHFFHGYGRQEIAELARLPISAIYNKLKTARAEVKTHLEEPGKLRVVNRNAPPEPVLSWKLLTAAELFKELRLTIMRARTSDCLAEEELLAHYRSHAGPIPCSLLAHIVSCERCLAAVDRHLRRPTLKDREPLDVFGFSPDASGDSPAHGDAGAEAMLRSVHRKWGRIHEHRPRTLSIAVNGHIVAYHDVRAEHNKLSARLEHPEKAQFVEVFSEQQVRLALLAVGEAPPEGPAVITQGVKLSDARWLELSLTYDGLGLHSEVDYFDPALASLAMEEDPEDLPVTFEAEAEAQGSASGLRGRLQNLWAALTGRRGWLVSSPATAWALVLVLLAGGGYFAYRYAYPSMDATEILHESIKLENAALQGQTEHQVLRIEESSADGHLVQQGTVDLWRDGDGGRYIRRLYDAQHRVIAAEWHSKNGKPRSSGPLHEAGREPSGARHSVVNAVWDQDLSAQAFAAMGDGAPQVRSVGEDYELTRVGALATHPDLVSATLVLDRHFQPIRQIMRLRTSSGIHEVRFVQASYERKPARSVPDRIFNPNNDGPLSDGGEKHSRLNRPRNLIPDDDTAIAELQIAVLHELHTLNADTGVPIEVARTTDGRVRVSGTVDDDALRRAILAHLKGLAGQNLLDLKLASSREMRYSKGGPSRPSPMAAYDVTQPGFAADARVRTYFQGRGFSGASLDSEAAKFSRDALRHAQLALQHAYALDRLGTSISANELRSVGVSTQKEWADMVNSHANDLESELRSLHSQLAQITIAGQTPSVFEKMPMDDPDQFAESAGLLLQQVRELNSKVGDFFTSSGKEAGNENLDASLKTIMDAIPLQHAEEVAGFAVRLGSASKTKAQTQ